MQFASLLHLPEKMPRELKLARINEVVNVLELNACMDTSQPSTDTHTHTHTHTDIHTHV